MPLPAIVGPILSVLAWVGIDLGLSAIIGGDDGVELVEGLDFPTFIGLYWPSVPIVFSVMVLALFIAFPRSKDGGVCRPKRRN